MPQASALTELLSQLANHVRSNLPVSDPKYQSLAAQYTQAVHGFGPGDVVDICDAEGATDNMPMVVELIELVELDKDSDPEKASVRIRGPIFCANPQFDGSAGEGTCRPRFAETFLRLN